MSVTVSSAVEPIPADANTPPSEHEPNSVEATAPSYAEAVAGAAAQVPDGWRALAWHVQRD